MIELTYFVRECEGTVAPFLKMTWPSNDGASCVKKIMEHKSGFFKFYGAEGGFIKLSGPSEWIRRGLLGVIWKAHTGLRHSKQTVRTEIKRTLMWVMV